MSQLSLTLTPNPEKGEVIIGVQIGEHGRLLSTKTRKKLPDKQVNITGSGPEFLQQATDTLYQYFPKDHYMAYKLISIIEITCGKNLIRQKE